MGIFALIFILGVLGFTLSWISGMVAKQEIDVKYGVIIVVITGVVTGLFGKFFADSWGFWPGLGARAAVWFVLMSLLLRAIGGIPLRKGAQIALVYMVLITGIQWGLSSCAESAAERVNNQ